MTTLHFTKTLPSKTPLVDELVASHQGRLRGIRMEGYNADAFISLARRLEESNSKLVAALEQISADAMACMRVEIVSAGEKRAWRSIAIIADAALAAYKNITA